ncbi:hypothetical protein [Sphingomonas sp. M1-B02]|uniref:hypothetical protein n=1 Tax=Sphingomonas sp. M1-B02 TaxID=3114300 RepID=UPI002240574B|nr:hypothetical protein [Sphingomonas sp. S6-11]UZK65472.1 hypothetical protein OKW87_13275 [Sphingomonas sp. S6-11]
MNDITTTAPDDMATGNARADADANTAPASNGKTALTDAFRTHFSGDAPLTEKAKSFAKARPWTSAAFVGVAAVAILNSLRGRR